MKKKITLEHIKSVVCAVFNAEHNCAEQLKGIKDADTYLTIVAKELLKHEDYEGKDEGTAV